MCVASEGCSRCRSLSLAHTRAEETQPGPWLRLDLYKVFTAAKKQKRRENHKEIEGQYFTNKEEEVEMGGKLEVNDRKQGSLAWVEFTQRILGEKTSVMELMAI